MQDVIDIEVTPLSAACGAEIKVIDLTWPLPYLKKAGGRAGRGSNGPRLRLWKVELQRLADETALSGIAQIEGA
jgi:hypothetical protein